MAIDYKSKTYIIIENYIILLPEKQIFVYVFDPKLIHEKPKLLSSIKLSKEVRFVQVVKESTFILCYSTGIEVYSIDELKGIRMTAQKKYDIPIGNNLNLIQIPTPYENIVNIFFEEYVEFSTSLKLWNIEI
jgi:hypothetical protein